MATCIKPHSFVCIEYTLQDVYFLFQACTKPLSLWGNDRLLKSATILIQWLLTGKGPGASSHLETGAFIRSDEGVPHPDIEYHFVPVAANDHLRSPVNQHAYSVGIKYYLVICAFTPR